jgi:hypothetical protein
MNSKPLLWFCLCLKVQAASLPDLTADVRASVLSRTNATSSLMFSSWEQGTKFVRNPRFWLNGTTGLSAIHVGGGPGAIAVTPWHVVGANHWKADVGAKVYFCDLRNHSIARTVVAGTEIRPDIKSDIWLALLDEPLPAFISPIALMPPDWTNHVVLSRFPVAALNKRNEFGSAEILSFSQTVSGWFLHGYLYKRSSLAPTLEFVPLQTGDSGRPIVTLVNQELVLLGHLTFEPGNGKFAGPDYSLYESDIQASIRALGTNQAARQETIKTIDLSRFR